MCIHLFNPPAPDCVPKSRCGNCHCAPKYWRLHIPAYIAYPGEQEQHFVPEWSAILSYSSGCHWRRLLSTADNSDQQHPMNLSWRLTYAPFVDLVSHAFVTTPGFVPDWCVWVPGNSAGPHAIAGDTVLYRKQPNAAAGDDTSNFTEQRHFRCLSENVLHYWGSLNVDPSGEAPGPVVGWPSQLTVTPWYGKKQA